MFGNEWTHYGPWFIISLVLAIWAIINILENRSSTPLSKSLWTVAVLFLPGLGFFAWFLFGPKSQKLLK